ncbi:ABC transporter permease [Teredinibacter sp. KSP-S5-2]|uniref:ABC transporter permease n=1 Tax=Teredinibacter sp. KSP-S5-2 TaxID=3034506 RepID=UPI002934A7D7|nr:FtsX-like permease family protein [Teredinibacter sp. KSP-S5-2]WNO10237.1 FtsX-like permease family protein [Teredinibacter sp. KSP-S5-2]
MNITLRLAWRNLWRNRRRTWLTVGAMIFSNVLLIFMISLQLGSYQLMIDNTLRTFSGHLQIQHPDFLDDPKLRFIIPDIEQLAEQVREALHSDQVAARSMAFVLASSEQRSYGIQVTGVQPEFEPRVSSIPGLVVQGRYLNGGTNEIVVGDVLAKNLKVSIGESITVLGSGVDGSFAAGVLTVVGIFDSGMIDIDRSMAQISLKDFQAMFSMNTDGNTITILANGLDEVQSLNVKLEQLISQQENTFSTVPKVRDWQALVPGLKQAIQADFASAWFMYAVLIILVSFSVLNTQLMSVLERTREFGTMMALGVRPARLCRLVFTETFLMSVLGLSIGVGLGFLLTLYLNHVGFMYPGVEEMAERFNFPSKIFPSVSLLAIGMGPSAVFVGSLLAALYPGLRLFFLQPIEAMRAN